VHDLADAIVGFVAIIQAFILWLATILLRTLRQISSELHTVNGRVGKLEVALTASEKLAETRETHMKERVSKLESEE